MNENNNEINNIATDESQTVQPVNQIEQNVQQNANNNYVIPNEIMYQTSDEIKNDIKKEKKNNKLIKELITLTVIVIIVLLIKQFLVTPIQVNGDSMNPTLKNGDIMILNKIGYKINGIKRFNIVVINNKDTLLIKRVIALPNETIKYENNKLYIDGKEIKEDYLGSDVLTNDFEAKTTDNCYFVMGDNRDVSLDSRDLGCFDISEIQGTTSVTIFPFDRFGGK